MFRRANRSRLDRILAAVEIPALGIWLGALCGFAFVFAPAAFRLVPDLGAFAALIAANLRALATIGAACGGVAIVVALLRSVSAADRTNDIARVVLIVIALALVAYETFAIVPTMVAITDVHGSAYHDLHGLSTKVYGAVVLLGFAALVLAAVREEG